jgi:hypothetical protein
LRGVETALGAVGLTVIKSSTDGAEELTNGNNYATIAIGLDRQSDCYWAGTLTVRVNPNDFNDLLGFLSKMEEGGLLSDILIGGVLFRLSAIPALAYGYTGSLTLVYNFKI